jgi:hypothetical protein
MRTRFKTGTATLIVVDPACVRHRLNDDADWWSIPAEEVAEINRGNALFVNLGSDGVYDLAITSEPPPSGVKRADALIRNESGRFFVGAGEYMTSEGMEPEAVYGNVFVERLPGAYRAVVWIVGSTLLVNLTLSASPAVNALPATPRVAKHAHAVDRRGRYDGRRSRVGTLPARPPNGLTLHNGEISLAPRMARTSEASRSPASTTPGRCPGDRP